MLVPVSIAYWWLPERRSYPYWWLNACARKQKKLLVASCPYWWLVPVSIWVA
jgi:hypothetical protein